jgi:hypothetical protein
MLKLYFKKKALQTFKIHHVLKNARIISNFVYSLIFFDSFKCHIYDPVKSHRNNFLMDFSAHLVSVLDAQILHFLQNKRRRNYELVIEIEQYQLIFIFDLCRKKLNEG